jgi:hypothetical protein
MLILLNSRPKHGLGRNIEDQLKSRPIFDALTIRRDLQGTRYSFLPS